jgi:peptidoglycan/LPS O-acetylase OafA/YrhL
MSMSQVAGGHARLPRQNNFDLLRFVFAVIVFLAHAYQLSQAPELAWLARIFSSELAVQCFFVVSGFLIFMSYENSASLAQYFDKRVRRIYPAYLVVVASCALLSVLLSILPWQEYFASTGFYRYLIANLAFLNFVQPDLPGIFDANNLSAVNGAPRR